VILAGDIGGTKTHLALYAPGGSAREPLVDRKLPSQSASSLLELIKTFLAEASEPPTRAVLGIAGPVVDNRSETTNLPWDVDAGEVSGVLGDAPVTLLNDLVATAHGLDTVRPDDLQVLSRGRPEAGNRALIAAGTGLGEALLPWDGTRWSAMASEGGHSDFAAREPLEDELAVWLRARYRRVSYERVLSGPGLADLHRFLRDTGRGDEPAAFARAFDDASDPAAVVSQGAIENTCERARLAVERFLEVYGAEAGNLALKGLAVGGVFVGGGIAPRLRALFNGSRFMHAFKDKGRLSPLMETVPVSIVLDPQTALWGAASVALAAAAEEKR